VTPRLTIVVLKPSVSNNLAQVIDVGCGTDPPRGRLGRQVVQIDRAHCRTVKPSVLGADGHVRHSDDLAVIVYVADIAIFAVG
jgi:hypothetical protein